jgi:hypothetical protein
MWIIYLFILKSVLCFKLFVNLLWPSFHFEENLGTIKHSIAVKLGFELIEKIKLNYLINILIVFIHIDLITFKRLDRRRQRYFNLKLLLRKSSIGNELLFTSLSLEKIKMHKFDIHDKNFKWLIDCYMTTIQLGCRDN